MNMNDMMKQAQQMQQMVDEAKKEIEGSVFTSEKGGEVTIHMYGTKIVKEIQISDVAMDDKEVLQDLILLAFNDCVEQIGEFTEDRMSEIAPGLGGLF
ncbi:MAG: YbaB/EbfC family nucleoid-associated protein [Bacilli bacterium]